MTLEGVHESIKNFCVIQEETPLAAPGNEKVAVEVGFVLGQPRFPPLSAPI
jgi:hypothetical protein